MIPQTFLHQCQIAAFLYHSDVTGGILKPTLAGSNQPPGQPEKLVSDDLDSSLANLVGSEFDALRCF